MADPLRYKISSWMQLQECLSNSSKLLQIRVSKLHRDEYLSGLRISVEHAWFGTLFATVLDLQGTLLFPEYPNNLSNEEILKQLENFGFLVEYDPEPALPKPQLEYLESLKVLDFDKIRVLPVKFGDGHVEIKIVAFNVEQNPNWLSYPYIASYREFETALAKTGSAVNLTEVSLTKHFDWSWLDYVANIQDILDDNKHEE